MTSRSLDQAFALVLFFLVVVPRHCDAADIRVETHVNGHVIFVEGRLTPVDGTRFADAVERVERGLVVLASDGGSLAAGLQMGNEIRAKRLNTLVQDGTRCASACAIAWLAGTRRLMGLDSHIGFHAAYLDQQGETTESAPANALIGGYLKMMGLSDEALVYITKAGPKSMTWLTLQDAKQKGIEVFVVPGNNQNKPNIPEEKPAEGFGSASSEATVVEFTKSYFSHWSDSNSATLEFFNRLYEEKVNYGGMMMDKERILQLKRGYLARWPERIYTVQPISLRSQCDRDSGTCEVTGRVDFDCRNSLQKRHRAGVSMFKMQLSTLAPGLIHIIGEWGLVIREED
jgi:hypothetical protein